MNILSFPVTDILLKAAGHYALGFGVGWLVYWWISTTLYRRYWDKKTGITAKQESCIHTYAFWLALCCSVLSHIIEDYTVNWF